MALLKVDDQLWKIQLGGFVENLHHRACHAKGTACLHAKAVVRRRGEAAAFAQVPRESRAWVVRIAHIRRRLVSKRDGVEGEHETVDEEAEEGHKNVHHEHDDFDQ